MDRRPDAAIAELAAAQHSAFSVQQAYAAGLSSSALYHRHRRGDLHRPLPGVYRPAGAAQTWYGDVMAAVLWAGPESCASHRTAAALHECDGIARSGLIDVTVPRGRYPRIGGIATHRSLLLGPADVTIVDSIPATTPARTLVDLGLVVPGQALEIALEYYVRRGLVTEGWLWRRLERLGAPLRPGSRPLVQLLLGRHPDWAPLESLLEVLVWDIIRASDLPDPTRQFVVVIDGVKYRLDFAYPDQLVGVEPAGFRWHSGRLRWGQDLRRAAALAAAGWRIVPVTSTDAQEDPDRIVRLIRRALAHGTVARAERDLRCHGGEGVA